MFFHSLVMPIIFFLKGSCYYFDQLLTTSYIKSLVHSSLTVARMPQKNFLSGYYLLSMSSSGKYSNTSGSTLTRCQTFLIANSGQDSLKLYWKISLVSKSFFSSHNTLDKKPLEHFFYSGNHLFTDNWDEDERIITYSECSCNYASLSCSKICCWDYWCRIMRAASSNYYPFSNIWNYIIIFEFHSWLKFQILKKQ